MATAIAKPSERVKQAKNFGRQAAEESMQAKGVFPFWNGFVTSLGL